MPGKQQRKHGDTGSGGGSGGDGGTGKAKKPWSSPRVKSGHLFESNSLACGKTYPPMDEQCAGQAATTS